MKPARRGAGGVWGMSETQKLLARITALRQRLEQAQASHWAADTLFAQVQAAEEHDVELEATVRPITGATANGPAPRTLTARARRVLERGRELLGQLRQ